MLYRAPFGARIFLASAFPKNSYMDLRIFIDFWNFTLQWNKKSSSQKLDWKKVANELRLAAQNIVSAQGLGTLSLQETRVYASYEPGHSGHASLKNWLLNFLDKQAGIRVILAERHWRQRPIHCRACKTEHTRCPNCSSPLGRSTEKGVDSQIVTDMMRLAWDRAYDVALLVSSDADFIPVVDTLQGKSFKVINASWKSYGNELARVSWASFEIDTLISSLART